jgi:hypothetical protein
MLLTEVEGEVVPGYGQQATSEEPWPVSSHDGERFAAGVKRAMLRPIQSKAAGTPSPPKRKLAATKLLLQIRKRVRAVTPTRPAPGVSVIRVGPPDRLVRSIGDRWPGTKAYAPFRDERLSAGGLEEPVATGAGEPAADPGQSRPIASSESRKITVVLPAVIWSPGRS